MGALLPAVGQGVKAVAAIWLAFAGFTAMFGSASLFTSLLCGVGIMLTTVTWPRATLLKTEKKARRQRIQMAFLPRNGSRMLRFMDCVTVPPLGSAAHVQAGRSAVRPMG